MPDAILITRDAKIELFVTLFYLCVTLYSKSWPPIVHHSFDNLSNILKTFFLRCKWRSKFKHKVLNQLQRSYPVANTRKHVFSWRGPHAFGTWNKRPEKSRAVLHLYALLMNRLVKTESGIFISWVISLLPKDIIFKTYLSSLQLMLRACVAALKVSPYFITMQKYFLVLWD